LEAAATLEPAQLHGPCDVKEKEKKESELPLVDELDTRHNEPDEPESSHADLKMPNAAKRGFYDPETSQASHCEPKGSNVHVNLEHRFHSDPQDELKKEPSMFAGEGSALASDSDFHPANSFRADDVASKKNDRLLAGASVDIPMHSEVARRPPSCVKDHIYALAADDNAWLDVAVANNHREKVATGSIHSNDSSVNTQSSHTSDDVICTQSSSHTNDVAPPEEAKLTVAPAPARKPKRSLVMDVEEENH
jgi:hypothetical protein